MGAVVALFYITNTLFLDAKKVANQMNTLIDGCCLLSCDSWITGIRARSSFFNLIMNLSSYNLHWWLPEENMSVAHIPPITLCVWEMICIRCSFSGNVHVCAFSSRRAEGAPLTNQTSSSQ